MIFASPFYITCGQAQVHFCLFRSFPNFLFFSPLPCPLGMTPEIPNGASYCRLIVSHRIFLFATHLPFGGGFLPLLAISPRRRPILLLISGIGFLPLLLEASFAREFAFGSPVCSLRWAFSFLPTFFLCSSDSENIFLL